MNEVLLFILENKFRLGLVIFWFGLSYALFSVPNKDYKIIGFGIATLIVGLINLWWVFK